MWPLNPVTWQFHTSRSLSSAVHPNALVSHLITSCGLQPPPLPRLPQRTGASRGGHRLVRPVTTRLNPRSTRQSACLPGHSPARPKQLPLHAGRTHKVSITAPLQHSWRSLTRATSAAGQGGAACHEWITSPRGSAR